MGLNEEDIIVLEELLRYADHITVRNRELSDSIYKFVLDLMWQPPGGPGAPYRKLI